MIIPMKDQLSKQAVTGEITAFFFLSVFLFLCSVPMFSQRGNALFHIKDIFSMVSQEGRKSITHPKIMELKPAL